MQRLIQRLPFVRQAPPIADALWQPVIASYPFLAALPAPDQQRLRQLAMRFLKQKEFIGVHGLQVTDAMAVTIAAQACLPVLGLPGDGLKLYDDFKGIVLHPGPMLARRERPDAAGVVHRYTEVLAGEAMQGGPVALSWQDVAASSGHTDSGYNVVIHEFVHKIDMKGGSANGCPPLPSRAAHAAWQAAMQSAFEAFRHDVVMADRFGFAPPWLDAYGATAPAEFFAVTSEAYFVNRSRFETDFAALAALFDTFY